MSSPTAIVVGAGGISGAWFPALREEQVQVKAVVDLRLEAAQRRIEEFGLEAEASTDLKAMLRKHRPDFVVDLTVPEAHCQVTCTALRAGCHVIGEKPMASSMPEARRMVRTAERTGRLYMVSQSLRWEPENWRIRQAIASGAIGELTTVNCDFYIGAHFEGFRVEMASPLLLDMSIHHFDLVRFFTGKDAVAVYALEFNPKGSWYRGNASAVCIFEMSDGVVFTYRGSWCSEGCHTPWVGNWRFIGTQGTLLYEQEREPWGEVVAGDTGFFRPLQRLELPEVSLPKRRMHGALCEMLEFLRTGKVPQTECHDNIKSLAMVFSALESARRGKRVPVRVE